VSTIPTLPLPTPRLVMFDVDYTLLRPSDQFEAAGYVRTGTRFGLDLDPRRWPAAERAAYAAVRERRRHTGDAHDEGLLEVIAHAVIGGLGGGDPAAVDAAAQAIIDAWSRMEHFGLYDDVRPCLVRLRGAGLRIALVSNAVGHALAEVIAHFALDDVVDAAVASADVGAAKPAPQVFLAALAAGGAAAEEAVMVGDSLEDDVEGALACGCGAILLDRLGRHPQPPVPRIGSLAELPAALGLPSL
jgi:HAD superfamily hydrolase (TIGR01549 family)